jgi:hypothetical protein
MSGQWVAIAQLDVGWNDLNYPNFQAISKIIATHAERFRQVSSFYS